MQSLLLPTAAVASAAPPRRGRVPPAGRASVSVRASAAAAVAPRRETDPRKRVVITGMGLVSVFGNDVDAYYDRLLAGESGIGPIDRFDASNFPTRFAGQIRGFSSEGYIDGKNDRRLDDCLRYCIVSGKKALESAGLALGSKSMDKIEKTRAGVLVGTGMGGLTVFSDGVQNLIEKGHRKITPFFIPYAITNMGSALLGMDIGFMGPNYSISTACATSNYCFYAAANHIRRGEADVMIAGGTEAAIIPIGVGGFVACRALSQRNDDPKTASRPWDQDRDGFVMGEGAGVLVMESLEHAMKRDAPIIAEYLGGAVNCDAYHMTDPRSDGLGVSSCIKQSLADAGVAPEEVNYINAHATSTLAGDLAEVNAIRQVFKDPSEIKINATKSMIGHCLGAAGGLEAIATVKAITTGWVHPSINQFNPEPAVEFDTVPNVKKQHEVNVGISNSFGFGGHNSVVVFAPFKP
uniref:3-oxoacyl-[acyl-carrier-protein] synthase n=3 Tax=Oryza TaxID=4527 RepID=A0A0E0D771_9ORYZ